MRLHRFYIPDDTLDDIDPDKKFFIDAPDIVHQIRDVLRLKVGDSIIVFDDSGADYTCRIDESNPKMITTSVTAENDSPYMADEAVLLCSSILKSDKYEWLVQKSTELGVNCITPMISERSEKKSLNMDRLKKIAIEASEQSGRGTVPGIDRIINFNEFYIHFNNKEGTCHLVAFDPSGKKFDGFALAETLAKGKNRAGIVVFIGPEGGWSPTEIEEFKKEDVSIYSLGDQTLRAETAAIAALTKLLL